MASNPTTNVSLRKTVYESSIWPDVDHLTVDHNANMDILEKALSGSTTIVGAAATVINTQGNRVVFINSLSIGSISTITGMLTNVPFTIICQSGTSFGIVDAGSFALSASLIFTPDDVLSLVWDGTRYYELGRSVN